VAGSTGSGGEARCLGPARSASPEAAPVWAVAKLLRESKALIETLKLSDEGPDASLDLLRDDPSHLLLEVDGVSDRESRDAVSVEAAACSRGCFGGRRRRLGLARN